MSTSVDNQGGGCGVFNPFSPEFKQAENVFHSLDGWRKAVVVIASIVGGIFFVVGAFPVFCWTANAINPGDSVIADKVDSSAKRRFSQEEKVVKEGTTSSKASTSAATQARAFNKGIFQQEAIDFAEKALESNPDVTPFQFSAGWNGVKGTLQPVDPRIARLTTLYYDVYYPAFEKVIFESEEKPWNQLAVIEAADNLMKIGYAISTWTLEDLPAFMANHPEGTKWPDGEDKRTLAGALTAQDSYLYRTFYYCTNVYHNIRGGVVKQEVRDWSKDDGNAVVDRMGYPEELSKEFVERFYEKGKIENKWNALYNSYCDHVRHAVKESDLKKADGRHVNWTKKDEKSFFGKISFTDTPDTQPT